MEQWNRVKVNLTLTPEQKHPGKTDFRAAANDSSRFVVGRSRNLLINYSAHDRKRKRINSHLIS